MNKVKRTAKKKFWNGGLILAAMIILMVGFLVGMVMIFGPAVMAEGGYQLKTVARALGSESGSWREVLTPNLRLILKPDERVAEFGIVIPKIFVDEKVVANVDPTDKTAYTPALREGIAHAAGTGLPGDGQMEYYFAHSSEVPMQTSRLNSIFYLLGKLETGDEISLWFKGVEYKYKVTKQLVSSAKDTSWLTPEAGKEQIALQTCWPVGTSLKRLVVVGEIIEPN